MFLCSSTFLSRKYGIPTHDHPHTVLFFSRRTTPNGISRLEQSNSAHGNTSSCDDWKGGANTQCSQS